MIAGCTAYDLIVVVRNSIILNDHEVIFNEDRAIKDSADPPQSSPATATEDRSIAASECMFRFGSVYSSNHASQFREQQPCTVYLIVTNPLTGDTMRFPISNYNTIQAEAQLQSASLSSKTTTTTSAVHLQQHDEAVLNQIVESIENGASNKAHYVLASSNIETGEDDEIIGIATCNIFVWPLDSKIAVVDVDGTITTSTLTGFWNTAILQDYSSKHCHSGVCQFLSTLVQTVSGQPKNLQVVYLTNRPITYVEATRNLLIELQQDSYHLPNGPLIGFTGDLAGVFKVRRTMKKWTKHHLIWG
jgi:LNS2 (Lipin/Ned1/Smp2)